MNLEESEKLIKEALDLDKKEKEKLKKDGKIDEVTPNAAYLDSLGWVLFKQKKYKEALEPLKQAAADDDEGAHLEIWDHLGDCHMALGQRKEAIAAWEKGLKFEDQSITKKVIPLLARMQGMDEATMIANTGAMVQLGLAELKNPTFTQKAVEAINAYLKDPRSLTILAKPAQPVTVQQLLALDPNNPGAAIDQLGVTISAND